MTAPHPDMPTYLGMPSFPVAARTAVADSQLRRNLAHATRTIRAKRTAAVAELTDWEALRAAAKAIKDHTLANLDTYLLRLEENVTRAGGHVHWAQDAAEANAIVTGLVRATGADQVVKVKSMVTQEIGLNEALAADGIHALETDLAELIVQLGHDRPSHILVPAIHRNRSEIREIFRREMPDAPADLSDDPAMLAAAARSHLRQAFLSAKVGISGANFAIAETGSLVVVESEGNGRMCLTLPQTLISVVGIEKILPSWRDLEVFLALLPRSSTAERLNPYTSARSARLSPRCGAASRPPSTPPCRSPPPCAAPAMTSARSRSTFPRRSCTCAARSSTPSATSIFLPNGRCSACLAGCSARRACSPRPSEPRPRAASWWPGPGGSGGFR